MKKKCFYCLLVHLHNLPSYVRGKAGSCSCLSDLSARKKTKNLPHDPQANIYTYDRGEEFLFLRTVVQNMPTKKTDGAAVTVTIQEAASEADRIRCLGRVWPHIYFISLVNRSTYIVMYNVSAKYSTLYQFLCNDKKKNDALCPRETSNCFQTG